MSLSKRMVLAMTLLILVVFIGTLSISVITTRNYLNQQLQITSQDTATSIGRSVADSIAKQDKEKLQVILSAIFDHGYYSKIEIRNMDGEVLAVRRQKKPSHKNVPDWFVNFIPLTVPTGRQEIISSDFIQLGEVLVSAHPGLAYKELWDTFVRNVYWVLIAGLLALGTVLWLIRYLLKPLRNLEHQANEIAAGNFVVQQDLPDTPELRRVVSTFNRMSVKVSKMLQAQTELTERMRVRAYQDALTGVNNRRYFAEQLDHLLKTPEEFVSGALMLVEISDFKSYNQKHGYIKADELLKETAEILSANAARISNTCLARVSGASFSLLAPNVNIDEIKALADSLKADFESLHSRMKIDGIATIHIGIAVYDGNQDSAELLSMADMALRAAQVRGPNSWHIYDEPNLTQSNIRGASAWKQVIKTMIREKNLTLHFQPVKSLTDMQIMHYEVLARMPDVDGNLVNAGTFLPMVQRHGMASGVDLVIIEKLLDVMGDENQVKYAVNISRASLEDGRFIDWLVDTIGQFPGRAQSLIFEVQEYSVASHLATIRENIDRIRAIGCEFSLDHFGSGSPDFGYLLNTKIDYIKIDGSYIHSINHNEDNRFFIKSITEIAHGLDIQVIGEYVETAQEWKTLQQLNLDGALGHFVGKPYADIAPEDTLFEEKAV